MDAEFKFGSDLIVEESCHAVGRSVSKGVGLLGFFKKNPKTTLNFPVHVKTFQPPPLEKFLDTPLVDGS